MSINDLGNVNWLDNGKQFPRLISEIVATQEKIDFVALAESMDLEVEQVHELFDRAQTFWEELKLSPEISSEQSLSYKNHEMQRKLQELEQLADKMADALEGLLNQAAVDGADPDEIDPDVVSSANQALDKFREHPVSST